MPGIRAATFDTGVTTLSTALAPIPNAKAPGLYNPYLAPMGNALPARAVSYTHLTLPTILLV